MATLHKNLKNSYIGPRSYTNHKGLTANYNMTDLTLNEIWADTKGIDLAWHAYINRNRKSSFNSLSLSLSLSLSQNISHQNY
ncbi:hypothetical protein E2C01_069970 [Portunus trituberculatus]|uniref:Uncharacterized protein n=1 Tax=Portunus trituberculatus TaxID=210409 RepID=A0A5B7HT01_PORTR|nr:hypothetical protein [Portunus trituberculatus]